MTHYAKLDRLKRKTQIVVDRDGKPLCIVSMQTNGETTLVVRKPARARNLVAKHKSAKLLATIRPT